jgi:hypothetical protein
LLLLLLVISKTFISKSCLNLRPERDAGSKTCSLVTDACLSKKYLCQPEVRQEDRELVRR